MVVRTIDRINKSLFRITEVSEQGGEKNTHEQVVCTNYIVLFALRTHTFLVRDRVLKFCFLSSHLIVEKNLSIIGGVSYCVS